MRSIIDIIPVSGCPEGQDFESWFSGRVTKMFEALPSSAPHMPTLICLVTSFDMTLMIHVDLSDKEEAFKQVKDVARRVEAKAYAFVSEMTFIPLVIAGDAVEEPPKNGLVIHFEQKKQDTVTQSVRIWEVDEDRKLIARSDIQPEVFGGLMSGIL